MPCDRSSDYNNRDKSTEKLSKYMDLQIECQRMWDKRVEVIPIINGATGIVDKTLKKKIPLQDSWTT